VLVTVPDAALEALMASPVILRRVWPSGYEEAMMLIHVLRVATPSLADALVLGLITMLSPASRQVTAEVTLAFRAAALTAVARGTGGKRIIAPHTRAEEVVRLDVTDLVVAGRSCLGMTG
jgi:hypothetical protein